MLGVSETKSPAHATCARCFGAPSRSIHLWARSVARSSFSFSSGAIGLISALFSPRCSRKWSPILTRRSTVCGLLSMRMEPSRKGGTNRSCPRLHPSCRSCLAGVPLQRGEQHVCCSVEEVQCRERVSKDPQICDRLVQLHR